MSLKSTKVRPFCKHTNKSVQWRASRFSFRRTRFLFGAAARALFLSLSRGFSILVEECETCYPPQRLISTSILSVTCLATCPCLLFHVLVRSPPRSPPSTNSFSGSNVMLMFLSSRNGNPFLSTNKSKIKYNENKKLNDQLRETSLPHNIIHIYNNVLWDWQYYVKCSSHLVWMVEYSTKCYRSHKTLLWIWIILCHKLSLSCM